MRNCVLSALHVRRWVVLALHVIATNRVRRTCRITMGTLKHEFHLADTPLLTIIVSEIPIYSCHANWLLSFFKAVLSKRGFDLALGFQRSGIFSRNFDRTPFRFNRDWLLNFGMRLTVGCMEIRCFLDLSLNNWTFYPGDSFQGTRRSSKI